MKATILSLLNLQLYRPGEGFLYRKNPNGIGSWNSHWEIIIKANSAFVEWGRGWTLISRDSCQDPIQGLLANLTEAASAWLRDIPEWTCPCVTAQWMPNRLGHFIQTWGTWLPRHMLCGWTHFCFSPHGWQSLWLRQQGTEVRRMQGGRSEKSVEEDWVTVRSQGVGDSGTDWWQSLPGWQGTENHQHRRLCWTSCFVCTRRGQAKQEQWILTVTKTLGHPWAT